MIYPHNFEQKIGFDLIRMLLKEKCLSVPGEEKADEMAFSDTFEIIDRELTRTEEFVRILEDGIAFPDRCFFDMRAALKKIRVEGTYLDEQELFDLKRSLETIRDIVRFLSNESGEGEPISCPELFRLTEGVQLFPESIALAGRLLDKHGRMKDDASAELARIRREMAATSASISGRLCAILKSAQAEGYVDKDVTPSIRDGRLVIPLAQGLKRKIKGIVHDESASGKTVFIEPAEVVEANNRIRELEGRQRREIIRLLTECTDTLRPLASDMLHAYNFLAQIDFIRAKALFSMEISAVKPSIGEDCLLQWNAALHPLLQRSLARNGRQMVPLHISLSPEKRLLIVSGPNAGGKSVCLKTVGLLQYMLQCGMPVPLAEGSRAGIFAHIFIDIGDEQSLENDLSTYSSHLSNMKFMVKNCNERTLILIDEFGSGTEPLIGGAIAEALLKRFNEKGCFGVVTTHYRNLKHYASEHAGIVNGAMLYNREGMQPLFRLEMGNPGSSFAVEIARKTGLPESIILDATQIAGKEYINTDKYLQDIVRDKQYWEKKRDSIRLQEKRMEEIIARHEAEFGKLKRERSEILEQARKEARRILETSNAEVEKTIRLIKEAGAERESTRSARRKLEEFRRSVEAFGREEDWQRLGSQETLAGAGEEGKGLRFPNSSGTAKKRHSSGLSGHLGDGENPCPSELFTYSGEWDSPFSQNLPNASKGDKSLRGETGKWLGDPPSSKEAPVLRPGSKIRLKGRSSVYEVLAVSKKKVTVAGAGVKMQVPIGEVEQTAASLASEAKKRSSFLNPQLHDEIRRKKLEFSRNLDLRGMRGEEALQSLILFIDDAVLAGADKVSILHGTGEGILRSLVRKYLATETAILRFEDEHPEFGGAGITVVYLK